VSDRKTAILDRLGPSGISSFILGLFPEYVPVGRDQALVRCLYHDEQNASLSIQLSTGLHNCKSCGASGDLFSLVKQVHGVDFKGALDLLEGFSGLPPAGAIAPKAKNSVKQRTVASFGYTDPAGVVLFSKDRLEPSRDGKKNKEFVYHRMLDGKRIYKLGDVVKYPYRVHTFAAAETIYFPEGEAKADLLASWGLCASCLFSGSEKWNPEHDSLIADKHIVVMPDKDTTGEKYATGLCDALQDVAASIKLLRLPGLQEKGDVLDWVKLPGNNRERFLELAAAAEPWFAPPSAELVTQRNEQSKERGRARRGAELLIPMLADCRLFRDDTGNGYMMLDGKLHLLDGKDRELFEKLLLLFWNVHNHALTKDAGATAVSYYSGLARLHGEDIELFKRVGWYQGKIYYDLHNQRAVEVSAGSWRIVEPPVMFQRYSHHLPQPDPLPGGNPWRVFEFVKLPEDSQLLFLVALITCFVPRINHPAFAIGGPQGSGKSTTQAVIKIIVDPSSILISVMPRKEEDLPLLLSRNHVTGLDNQSYFGAGLADLLCASITGGIVEKRVLHTDSEMMAVRVPGVITYSAISQVSDRPDLHERTIRFILERLDQNTTMSEERFYKRVADAVPEILGGVFDVLARAVELQPMVEDILDRLPRMADFAIWGYAIAEALGNRGAEFIQAYSGNASLAVHDLLANNRFFAAIVEAMEEPVPLSGTFAAVIRELQKVADPDGEQNGFKALARDTSFPKSHHKFREAVERLKVPLNALGINCNIIKHETKRGRVLCTFSKIEDEQSPAAVDLAAVVFDETEVVF
jgi:hypothetical protein